VNRLTRTSLSAEKLVQQPIFFLASDATESKISASNGPLATALFVTMHHAVRQSHDQLMLLVRMVGRTARRSRRRSEWTDPAAPSPILC